MTRWSTVKVKESVDGKRFHIVGIWDHAVLESLRNTVPGGRFLGHGRMSVAVKWRQTVDDILAGRPISQKRPAAVARERREAMAAKLLSDGRCIVPTAEIRGKEHAMLVRAVRDHDRTYLARWFFVRAGIRADPTWVGLDAATKDGTRDERGDLGWSGDYGGCLWYVPGREVTP